MIDDLIVASNSETAVAELKQRIQERFQVKILGPLQCFLSIQVIRDRPNQTIWLKQNLAISDTLSEFNMSDCHPVRTPELTDIRLHSGMCPQTDAERSQMALKPYRAAVGKLIYLATKTRPDIAHAVQQVAQFCENPGQQHWDAIKRIFAYLKGTLDHGLEFSGNSNPLQAYFNKGPTNCPVAAMFSDSDWANDLDKRKSVGGYVFMLHGGTVDYNSKKLTNTPLSSTEAEWYAACEAAKHGKWLRNLLFEIGFPMQSPLIIF